WRQFLRKGVDAGVVYGKVLSLPSHNLPPPEFSDHVDGFLQHLKPYAVCWPTLPDNVFVETLACSNSEKESSRHRVSGRRGGLREECGMHSHDGARHAGSKPESLGGLTHGPNDYPDEWTMALLVDP